MLNNPTSRVESEYKPLGVNSNEAALRTELVYEIPVVEVRSLVRRAKQFFNVRAEHPVSQISIEEIINHSQAGWPHDSFVHGSRLPR